MVGNLKALDRNRDADDLDQRPRLRGGRLSVRSVGVSPDFIRTITLPTPFPVGPVNVYLVLARSRHPDRHGPADGGGLGRAHRRPLGRGTEGRRDVRRVLLTHGHQDHFGLARRVADLSGAALWGGRLDRQQFRMRRNSKLLLDNLARADFGLLPRLAMMLSVSHVDRFAAPLDGVGRARRGRDSSGRRLVGRRPLDPGTHARKPHLRDPRGRRPLHRRHGPAGHHPERHRRRGPRTARRPVPERLPLLRDARRDRGLERLARAS